MPLVYTQVVNIAVRTYFIIALFARQYMIGERSLPNKHVSLMPCSTVMSRPHFLYLFIVHPSSFAEHRPLHPHNDHPAVPVSGLLSLLMSVKMPSPAVVQILHRLDEGG